MNPRQYLVSYAILTAIIGGLIVVILVQGQRSQGHDPTPCSVVTDPPEAHTSPT